MTYFVDENGVVHFTNPRKTNIRSLYGLQNYQRTEGANRPSS